MNALKTLVPLTGEVIEVEAETPEQAVDSLVLVNQYLEGYEKLKAELKKKIAGHVEQNGPMEHNGWSVRVYTAQRMSYDKAIMRQVFDEDLMDTFLEPSKGRVDSYVKAHLGELGDASTRLRESMIPAGKPYTTVRLERLERQT